MNIAVCLKQVPGTTRVQIDPQTNTLIRRGVKSIINPFDTYALEEGVRLKERGGGKVTVISMGPPQAEEALREAISLGAVAAVLLSDAAFAGADTYATAFTLSKAIKKLGAVDLVLCGRQTIDGDTGQVAPELAEMLGTPFVAYVSQIENLDGTSMRVRRMVDDGYEVIETPLPAVISVVKEINTPRLPSLRGLARAKAAQVPVWSALELGVEAGAVGQAGSFTRVVRVFSPQRVRKGETLTGEIKDQVECLIGKLRESKVI